MKTTEISNEKLEFIDRKVMEFINHYQIAAWPIDCIQLISRMEKQKTLKIHIQPSALLPANLDVKTIKVGSSYYLFVNKPKLHSSQGSFLYRHLNFSLAQQLGHIYLNHFDLPNAAKSALDVAAENKESYEFAHRLLMPTTMFNVHQAA